MADKRGSDSKKWSGGFTEAEMQAAAFRRRMKEEEAAPVVKKEEKKKKSKKHHKGDKDEFGRDIMPGMASRSPSQSSRSSSPPPDPIRPDLDEQRHSIKRQKRRDSRSRSRERSRDRSRDRSRSRERRRSSDRKPSGRGRSRSRSRSRGRRVDVAKKEWTHDAFFNRSPSPIRQVDPFYKPNPESWVSRAGGVYIPKQ